MLSVSCRVFNLSSTFVIAFDFSSANCLSALSSSWFFAINFSCSNASSCFNSSIFWFISEVTLLSFSCRILSFPSTALISSVFSSNILMFSSSSSLILEVILSWRDISSCFKLSILLSISAITLLSVSCRSLSFSSVAFIASDFSFSNWLSAISNSRILDATFSLSDTSAFFSSSILISISAVILLSVSRRSSIFSSSLLVSFSNRFVSVSLNWVNSSFFELILSVISFSCSWRR